MNHPDDSFHPTQNPMKTPTLPTSIRAPFHLAMLAAAGLLANHPFAYAQVVIEGGPGPIQKSDQDGLPEPVLPGGAAAPFAKEPQIPMEPEPPETAVIQPNAQSPATILVPVKSPAAPVTGEAGAVSSTVPAMDVVTAKRKAELVRELGIAESSTGAKIAFSTRNLYETDSALIAGVATRQLQLLAEFIRLSSHKGIGVTYHYTPALQIEKLAWQRSVSLVEWMKTFGALPQTAFTVMDPEEVTQADPSRIVGEVEASSPLDRIEIVVDYR